MATESKSQPKTPKFKKGDILQLEVKIQFVYQGDRFSAAYYELEHLDVMVREEQLHGLKDDVNSRERRMQRGAMS